MSPLLSQITQQLAKSFASSNQGCFLWVTAAILREFAESVDEGMTDAIYTFFEQQATTMLRMLNNLNASDLPDVIEDFFRLLLDAISFYPQRLITSPIFPSILDAAISSSLTLELRDPLIPTLHYIRDVIAFGGNNPPVSNGNSILPEVKLTVAHVLAVRGEHLVNRVMAGMMITWPRDCFPDGSGVLLGLFELLPQETSVWIGKTLSLLPPGTITPDEANKLMVKINTRLSEGQEGTRQVRSLLQDFTNSYRRRYVAPRDGLGGLEATRFRFSG